MSNSPLVSVTRISPNRTSPRNHAIDTLTIHCTAVQVTPERLGEIFAPTSKQASSNYGVGKDGRIGMYVEEKDRSWCSSNRDNDHRAVTIEVSSDSRSPYAVNSVAFAALLDLVTDICRRNGKRKLLWFGDKAKTLAYNPAPDEMVMTVHRWFANKACPGDYLFSRMGAIADTVNARLAPPPSEAEKAVDWITDKGIMLGNTSGDLMLDQPITRKQFAVMLYRYDQKRK